MLCKQSCTKSPIHLTSWKLESTCKMWCSSPLASDRWEDWDYSQQRGLQPRFYCFCNWWKALRFLLDPVKMHTGIRSHKKCPHSTKVPHPVMLASTMHKECYMPRKMIENEMDASFTIKEIVHLKLGTLNRAKSWDRCFITMEVLPFRQIPIPRTAH
jgi:hypothetical protein